MTFSLTTRLVAEGLACEKGERLLFAGLSFGLASTDGLVITGPNGSGKTSLLRIMAGLAAPAAGSVRIEGSGTEKSPLEEVHFFGSRDGLKASMTPREHCQHWQAFYGAARSDILDLLHLHRQADIPASALSSGQRRRLAFGRLLMVPRPIWLLDEPMNALDPDMREGFMAKAMAEHRRAGGILVASTHISLGVPGMMELAFNEDGSHSMHEAVT